MASAINLPTTRLELDCWKLSLESRGKPNLEGEMGSGGILIFELFVPALGALRATIISGKSLSSEVMSKVLSPVLRGVNLSGFGILGVSDCCGNVRGLYGVLFCD